MNILFVYYLPSGGVETLNRQRSVALKKKGINCHFLYYQKKRDLVNDHKGQTMITNDDEIIKNILEKGDFSAIVITSDHAGLERFRNLGYEGTLIFEIQGLGTEETAQRVIPEAIPYILKYSDGILMSKTPHIIELLKKQPQLPPTFIFNNCFDTARFSYTPPQHKYTHPIIGWIGRIEDNKNWIDFLQIGHKLIYSYNPNIQLYIFEDATLSTQQNRERFSKMIKDLHLESNITLFSNIPNEEMPIYYSMIGDSGGLVCSTSITEGFGYAIVEAMSCRCPVLSTRSDGVSNSIIHNKTGKYYNIGNIEEASHEIIELLSNNTLRIHIITSALQHIQKEFNPETYCQHFSSMLEALKVRKRL